MEDNKEFNLNVNKEPDIEKNEQEICLSVEEAVSEQPTGDQMTEKESPEPEAVQEAMAERSSGPDNEPQPEEPAGPDSEPIQEKTAKPDNNPETEKVPDNPVPKEKPEKKKARWPWILALIVLLAGAVYGGGYYYYSSHFPHGIYANGKKLGELTVEQAEKVFTEDLESHSITLKEKEREEVIDAAAIGTVIDVGTQVQDLFDSLNPALWFTNIFGKKENKLVLDVTYDQEAMTAAVDSLEAFKEENVVAPVNTSIKAGETEFEIVPEVLGNTILRDDLLTAIDEALATCQTSIDLEKKNLYLLPQYFADDEVVKTALETANKYSHGTIVHDFSYATETIDYQTIKDWIIISKDFEVSLSSSDVGDYVESLGKKYNTMGSSRPFTTAYGSKINVYDGDYGWRIDFKKEKKKLIKEIKSGEDVNRKPIYSYTAAIQTEKTDIDDSYVEVSISRQELWLFIDGECILNTSVVTGRPGFDTEKGVYGITYKKRNEVLEGFNADGTTYASPVSYWMPFNGNQGLHDASWRDSFGGSLYKTQGSHGCVNCPSWAAATLYKYVDENFPVIIY